MLELIEKFNAQMADADSDAGLVDVLREICSEFGFRDAYFVDFPWIADQALSALDTRADRLGWWKDNIITPQRGPSPETAAILAHGGVIKFDGMATLSPDNDLLPTMQQLDLLQTTMVPIKYDDEVVGLVGYSGWLDLSQEREIVLQVLTYNLLAQKRALRSKEQAQERVTNTLTPREREVMNLAAEGKTSNAIAEALGMAARTVNQHVENVGAKLGTRNRAHTVAEAIRRQMLS